MHLVVPALIGMMLLASPVLAQSTVGYVIPHARAPRDPLPHFTIAPRGGALAPIGLPLPQIGLQPPIAVKDAPDRRHGRAFYPWPVMLFYVPEFTGPLPTPTVPPEPKPELPRPVPGRLVLEVSPAHAQVFADGYYVGMPVDFSGERGGGVLDAGIHRLDVSAPGYEPIT